MQTQQALIGNLVDSLGDLVPVASGLSGGLQSFYAGFSTDFAQSVGSLRAGSTLYQSSFESYLLQLSDMAAAYGSFMDERNAKTSTVQFILKTKE